MAQQTLVAFGGPVDAVHDTGIKVGGAWRNYSKPEYYKGQVPPRPAKGDVVRGTATPRGYIKTLEILAPAAALNGAAPEAAARSTGARGKSEEERLEIRRQSAMKSAVGYVAALAPVQPDRFKDFDGAKLFAMAERIEAWIARPAAAPSAPEAR